MEKALENGTEVLIFKHVYICGLDQYIEQYIRGIVIKSELSRDLSYHGSPWYVINYTVLGEDGVEYFGNYLRPTLGNSFFMTEEDYVYYLNDKIASNEEKILKIKNENQKIEKIIKKVKTGKKRVLSK